MENCYKVLLNSLRSQYFIGNLRPHFLGQCGRYHQHHAHFPTTYCFYTCRQWLSLSLGAEQVLSAGELTPLGKTLSK